MGEGEGALGERATARGGVEPQRNAAMAASESREQPNRLICSPLGPTSITPSVVQLAQVPYKDVAFTGYVFNLGWVTPTVVLSLSATF